MRVLLREKIYLPMPYAIMLAVNLTFIIVAFSIENIDDLFSGFGRILSSRSILVSDYLAIGGVGATLLNVAITGIFALIMLTGSRIAPSGAIIMALWLTAGFAFFGKNVFNMIPLTIGVWLYSKYRKEPYTNYVLASLLVATLSPVVSELSFLGMIGLPAELLLGITMGFFIGFIFPPISSHIVRAHGGYDLYSMGFAGGLIATVLATTAGSLGFDIVPSNQFGSGNNRLLSYLLYGFALVMILCGVLAGVFEGRNKEKVQADAGDTDSAGGKRADNGSAAERAKGQITNYLRFHNHSGRLITDFYFLYKYSVYINMGVLCAFATTFVLVTGAELGGIVVAGILTIVGFGAFGKHIKNILPVMAGAVISALLNVSEFTSPGNIAAILFSTALAPVAGQFGWYWGVIAGFLHVGVSMYIGQINGGLNLYNNGFAAGLVAMLLLPVITVSRKMMQKHED